MDIIVKKFGGKLLASIPKIQQIAKNVAQEARQGGKIVVVVSAMGDTTEQLITLSKLITDTPPKREYDALLASGEQAAMSLFAMALSAAECPVKFYTGFQAKILTKKMRHVTDIVNIDTKAILKDLRLNRVVVVAGFQGVDIKGNITTLGRGGSDLTAVALAAFLHATSCEIYKDTGGVYSIDPHRISNSYLIPFVTYDEMLAISNAGASLLQAQAVKLAKAKNVRIHIMDGEKNQCGTVISADRHRQNGYFYSMVEDNAHVFAQLKENIAHLHVDQEALAYMKANHLNCKIIKTITHHYYLSLLSRDLDKIKSQTFFKYCFHKNLFKKLSVISDHVDVVLAAYKKNMPADLLTRIEIFKNHKKNIITFFIRSNDCNSIIEKMHLNFQEKTA